MTDAAVADAADFTIVVTALVVTPETAAALQIPISLFPVINIQTARKISNGRKIARMAPIWTKI